MPRALQEVVFVDGVRTPFGKAGEKGMYAQTRADDLVIKCIRELLRRHPELPGERVEEVAIAATTQIGDQGLTLGRLAALLSGSAEDHPRLLHRPDVRRRDDRRHQRRELDRVRRDRRRDRRRRRAHGPPPDGRGHRPQPADRLRADRRRVGPRHGQDRREPARPLPAPDQGALRRVCREQPAQARRRLRGGQGAARPRVGRDPPRREGLGAGHRRRAAPPRHHARGARRPEDPVPRARQRHRRQRRRASTTAPPRASWPPRRPPPSSGCRCGCA